MEETRECVFKLVPQHLLHEILKRVQGRDLASVECSCRSMALPCGGGSMALPELVAYHICLDSSAYHLMSAADCSSMRRRLGGSWKALADYLTLITNQSCVAAGFCHTLVFQRDGTVVSFGSGNFGVLGHGLDTFSIPRVIDSLAGVRVTQVSATHNHAALVTDQGQVFAFGDNSSHCCGNASTSNVLSPALVTSLQSVPCKKVATGLSFTIVLACTGKVYSFGNNSHGQLGHGDFTDKCDAEEVFSLTRIRTISAGKSFSLAVSEDGVLSTFGYGGNFCLGHGGADNEPVPRPVETFQQRNVRVVDAVAGTEHCIAMNSRGQVYTWGKGYCGALGHGNEDDYPVPEILKTLGKLVPVQVFAGHRRTFIVGFDGTVVGFGWVQVESKLLQPETLDILLQHKVVNVSSGRYHTIFVTRAGLLLGIGDNEKGQLGLEDLRVWHRMPHTIRL